MEQPTFNKELERAGLSQTTTNKRQGKAQTKQTKRTDKAVADFVRSAPKQDQHHDQDASNEKKQFGSKASSSKRDASGASLGKRSHQLGGLSSTSHPPLKKQVEQQALIYTGFLRRSSEGSFQQQKGLGGGVPSRQQNSGLIGGNASRKSALSGGAGGHDHGAQQNHFQQSSVPQQQASQIEQQQKEQMDAVIKVKCINLYVQLPGETMSELIREHVVSLFDKQDLQVSTPKEENIEALNLTLNASSLIKDNITHGHPHPFNERGSILSRNPSATAEFISHKLGVKSPYNQPIQSINSQRSRGSSARRQMLMIHQQSGTIAPLKNTNIIPNPVAPIGHSSAPPKQSTHAQAAQSPPPQKELYFKLGEVIQYVKRQGFPIDGTVISYYSSIFSAFVNCSLDPIGDFVHIQDKDLELIADQASLRLRFEKNQAPIYPDSDEAHEPIDFLNESISQDSSNRSKSARQSSQQNPPQRPILAKLRRGLASQQQNKISQHNDADLDGKYQLTQQVDMSTVGQWRTKERTIAYVIAKVSQWRRLYNGYYDSNFNHQRLSLEDAADSVGVSKKSLDDYLSQLRSGRQCGYNFNANKHEKVGHLRRFVKDHFDSLARTSSQYRNSTHSIISPQKRRMC